MSGALETLRLVVRVEPRPWARGWLGMWVAAIGVGALRLPWAWFYRLKEPQP